jgi:hypothetical protein
VYLLHITQTPLELVTLVILEFCFFFGSCCCSALFGHEGGIQSSFLHRVGFSRYGFLTLPFMMVILPFESTFGSGFIVVCVILKLL